MLYTSHRIFSASLGSVFCLISLVLLTSCGSSGGGDGEVESAVKAEGPGGNGEADLIVESVFDPNWPDTGVFSPASACADCHDASPAAPEVLTFDGKNVSPFHAWQHSMMAQSVSDPYYLAAVTEESAQFPELSGFIEDTCLTCHAPMGLTHAHLNGVDLDPMGYYRLETALDQMPAREGVSCSGCHQILDDGTLGTKESFSGAYEISGTLRTIFGPYISPVMGAMQNNTQYSPAYGSHMTGSELCATCHTLFTPTLSAVDGKPTGNTFPEQTPYLEWLNSVYATGESQQSQCQDCHMPAPGPNYSTVIATRPNGSAPPPGWPSRSTYAQHDFLGGNTHTLEIMREYRNELGLEESTTDAGFVGSIEKTREFLGEKAALVDIESVNIVGNEREILVRVTNLAGHKLPSAYPSRRMWINLEIKDALGEVVFDSGTPDSRGHLTVDANHLRAGCTDLEPTLPAGECYESHRNIIDSPDQIAIYESVLGDTNGNLTYVLLRGDSYLKDNRIPPKGFARSAVPTDGVTAIRGAAVNDADFNAETLGRGNGEDLVRYRVNVSGYTAPYEISVRLLYQSVRPTFVSGLHQDSAPRVVRYKDMYEQIPPSVELLAESADTVF